jgi:hypothetical protein
MLAVGGKNVVRRYRQQVCRAIFIRSEEPAFIVPVLSDCMARAHVQALVKVSHTHAIGFLDAYMLKVLSPIAYPPCLNAFEGASRI